MLIVDDSALIRSMLNEILSASSRFEVVGMAEDPYDARDKIKILNPDVITLDIEMPKMTGLQFLSNIMRLRPMPVVMISTLTEKGAPETLEALALGAIDYVCKPKANTQAELDDFAREVVRKVKIAASAKVRSKSSLSNTNKNVLKGSPSYKKVIAIGSSTGGTEAIKEILETIPENCPPIFITQHIPEVFSASFAMRLDRSLLMRVVEAKDGMPVESGTVYIAPGGRHFQVVKQSSRYVCKIIDTDKVNRHRPSVEVMFDSILESYGNSVVTVMLTGMGADGAAAMARLKQKGSTTIAQDEASSVVWGMPQAAIELGAADHVLPLSKIAEKMLHLAK